MHALKSHASWVRSLNVSRDGQKLISASDDRTVRIWDLVTGDVLAVMSGHAASVSAAAFCLDYLHAVSAAEDMTVKLWRLSDGTCLGSVTCESPMANCLITDDGTRAVAIDELLRVHVFSVTLPPLH